MVFVLLQGADKGARALELWVAAAVYLRMRIDRLLPDHVSAFSFSASATRYPVRRDPARRASTPSNFSTVYLSGIIGSILFIYAPLL